MLLDALQKPEADLGLELPSLLEWRHVEEGKVDHVVLGRGKPGGIWQVGILSKWPNEQMGIWAHGKSKNRRYIVGGQTVVYGNRENGYVWYIYGIWHMAGG